MEFMNRPSSNGINSVQLANLFQQTHTEALQKNEENRTNWTTLKEDHVTLRSQLETLPDALSQDVMVPIGPRAFMKGKIVHTNEIFVCLGAGWFAKQSAKCAAEICDRRIAMCDETLANLNKEKELLSSRMQLPLEKEVFRDEITELYNEEDEAKWRVRHKEKEREYRQQLKTHRNVEKLSKTDEELWNRLEELELQEELQQELDKFHDEQDENDNLFKLQGAPLIPELKATDIISQVTEEHSLKRIVLLENGKRLAEINNMGIGECASSNDEQPTLVSELPASVGLSNELLGKNNPKRRVSFVEESSFAEFIEVDNNKDEDSNSSNEPLYIRFNHSALLGQSQRSSNTSGDQVLTPGDIYNIVPKITPKSILKQKSHDSNALVNETDNLYSSLGQTECNFKPSKKVANETDIPLAFGDVIERSTEEINNLQDVCSEYKRPVSRFRANRQTTT